MFIGARSTHVALETVVVATSPVCLGLVSGQGSMRVYLGRLGGLERQEATEGWKTKCVVG
jgi:hypothetical protein